MQGPHAENWNFGAIYGQTVTMGAGRQLGSPHVVLPFLLIAAGGSVLAGALIVPIVELCRLLGFAGSAPVIRAAKGIKWHLALILAATAAAIATVGIATNVATPGVVAILILAAAAVVGFGMGATTLVHQDLLGRLLSESRRGNLMYGEAIFAGVLAIAIAVVSHLQLADGSPLDRHLAVLWAGVFVLLASAAFVAIVREQPTSAPGPAGEPGITAGFLTDFRVGVRKVVQLRWAQQFIVARILFLAVELALPFYAIHAAIHQKHVGTGLTVLLVATCAAMIVGGALWRWIHMSSRTVMVWGTIFAAFGGLLAVAIETFPQLRILALHGVVLFLVALGAVSIVTARSLYVISMAPSAERPYFVAVASVSTISVAILAAFVLGLMAELTSFAWPIYCLVAATVAAGLWAAWLPNLPPRQG